MQTTLPFIETNNSIQSFEEILYSINEKRLIFDFSNRMKKSWKISRSGKVYKVTVPAAFQQSPNDTKVFLIEWAQILLSSHLSRKRLSTDKRERVATLEQSIWHYLHGNSATSVKLRNIKNPHERFRHSFGANFDLKLQFSLLNEEYYNSELTSFLRWGQHGSKTSYHTMIADENLTEHHLITIAGLYNHPSVPQYALDGVLYHEMLHIACPPKEGLQRRNVHHNEFRVREQEYKQYDKWQAWLRKDAQKILRQLRKKSR